MFGVNRSELPSGLRTPGRYGGIHGLQTIRGMPFLFGDDTGPNVVLLEDSPVAIDLGSATATYVLFVHVVEDVAEGAGRGWARDDADGDRLGGVVSEYVLGYEDGSSIAARILRRFAIQQARCAWGSAPFACVPAADVQVVPTADEALVLGRQPTTLTPTRAQSVASSDPGEPGVLWIYALKNPKPDVPASRGHVPARRRALGRLRGDADGRGRASAAAGRAPQAAAAAPRRRRS